MLRILLFIGFLMASVGASNYIYYPEVKQSYKFHKAPQEWSDAIDTCHKEGATLAMPKNEAEVSVLKKIFDGYPTSILKGVKKPDILLINIHDMFTEGEYLTDNGESIQYYFHTWNDGEPNNSQNNENCGSLLRSGVLNDFPCNIPAVFICQKNKNEFENLPSLDCISPDPAYKYSIETGKCYKLHLNPKIWAEARTICKAEGGNLAIINSKKEEDFLVAMFTESRDKIKHIKDNSFALLGFHDIFHEGHFITVEDDELQDTGYTRWSPGEPNNDGGYGNCGSMHISGGLNDLPCSRKAVFFCEVDSNQSSSLDQRLTMKKHDL